MVSLDVACKDWMMFPVAEGIAVAREMFDRVRGAVQGVQVSAPFGKVELALQVFAGTLVPPTLTPPPVEAVQP